MPRKFDDLTGQKFGKLEIVSLYGYTSRPARPNWKHRSWLCKCECGNYKPIIESDITSGNTNSCGCLHPSFRHGKNSPKWRGYGDISIKFWTSVIKSADKRSINFDITIQYAWDLFEQQNKRCALTGRPLIFTDRVRTNYSDTTASLDRINNNFGYIIGNVQWVHKDINRMK